MFGGECVGVVVYSRPGCGGVGGGSVGLWGFVVGFAYWCVGFHCLVVCERGFGCGSVMIGVTLIIGCVWLTM